MSDVTTSVFVLESHIRKIVTQYAGEKIKHEPATVEMVCSQSGCAIAKLFDIIVIFYLRSNNKPNTYQNVTNIGQLSS